MQQKILFRGLGFILLFLALVSLRYLYLDNPPGLQIWNGHQILLVPKKANISKASALLTSLGYENFNSDNQFITMDNYGSQKTLKLSDINSQFDPLDPRIDPFISRLSGYFYGYRGDGSDWNIIYIKTDKDLSEISRNISNSFNENGIEFVFPELSGKNPINLIIFLVVFFVILSLSFGKKWWRGLILILAWVGCTRTEVPSVVLSNLLLVLGISLLGNELLVRWGKHDGKTRGDLNLWVFLPGTAISFGAFALLLAAEQGGAFPGLIVGGLAQSFWYLSELFIIKYLYERRLHPLFRPVPLYKERVKRPLPVRRSMASGAVLLFMVVFTQLNTPQGDWILPQPLSTGDTLSFNGVEELWLQERSGELPDLADYLAHRAYQESFFYGGCWGFPNLGDSVDQLKFSLSEEVLKTEEITILEFTSTWYMDILSDADSLGIPGLLVSQNSPVEVGVIGVVSPPNQASWYWGGIVLLILYSIYPGIVAYILGRQRDLGPRPILQPMERPKALYQRSGVA